MKDWMVVGIIMAVLLLVIMLPILMICGFSSEYSDGERTGSVTKLSRKGLFCKTWEGEMNLGGAVNSNHKGLVANVWQFTVDDDAVLLKIQEGQRAGKLITVEYHQWLIAPVFRTESGYIVKAVR